CLYISACDNDKQVTKARKAPPDMWAGVIPTMEMAEAANAGVAYERVAAIVRRERDTALAALAALKGAPPKE
ncbi:MAG: hypothetical protein LC793_21145, partial [Thermomicrobia bacterium]|nr:hypothetical protein [Thermomicrobia bacterium]